MLEESETVSKLQASALRSLFCDDFAQYGAYSIQQQAWSVCMEGERSGITV